MTSFSGWVEPNILLCQLRHQLSRGNGRSLSPPSLQGLLRQRPTISSTSLQRTLRLSLQPVLNQDPKLQPLQKKEPAEEKGSPENLGVEDLTVPESPPRAAGSRKKPSKERRSRRRGERKSPRSRSRERRRREEKRSRRSDSRKRRDRRSRDKSQSGKERKRRSDAAALWTHTGVETEGTRLSTPTATGARVEG